MTCGTSGRWSCDCGHGGGGADNAIPTVTKLAASRQPSLGLTSSVRHPGLRFTLLSYQVAGVQEHGHVQCVLKWLLALTFAQVKALPPKVCKPPAQT
jgi:hypothetical protein